MTDKHIEHKVTRLYALRHAAQILIGHNQKAIEDGTLNLAHWTAGMQAAQVWATIGSAMDDDEEFSIFVVKSEEPKK